MSSEIVLNVQNLGKRYEIYNAPHHRLLQTLLRGRKQFYKEFWALKDISFELKKGECLGIIGQNGGGKSTLLQLIAGTLAPTTGSVNVNGKIAALLELGSGFNPEFTGRENVYMNGAIMGFSRVEMDEKFDEIAAFADIGDFIDQPVKIYSSGMMVRLAFAAAINVDPDVLIIDEALAVGDVRFQQKCFRKLKKFRDDERTVLFVSHDLSAVKLFCERTIWLEQGQVKRSGMPDEVTKEYLSFMAYGFETETVSSKEISQEGSAVDSSCQEIKWGSTAKCESFGEGGATILATAFYSKARGERITTCEGGEDVCYYVKIKVHQRIESPIIGFILNDDHGVHVLGYNSQSIGISLDAFCAGEERIFCFSFKFPFLRPSVYFFNPAIADGTQLNHVQLHWVHDAYMLQVINAKPIACLGNSFIVEGPVFFEKTAQIRQVLK